jgi:hypothetical protein
MAKLSEILAHPEEWPALFLLYMRMRRTKQLLTQTATPQWQFAYEMLTRTSRSFALVIQELQGDLRDAISIFYLVGCEEGGVGSLLSPCCCCVCVCVFFFPSFFLLPSRPPLPH